MGKPTPQSQSQFQKNKPKFNIGPQAKKSSSYQHKIKGKKTFPPGKGNNQKQNHTTQPRRRKLNNLTLTFNPDARKEFLTGFHKRKLERKALYKTKLEKDLVKEKARLREETKKSIGPTSSSHQILPEVEKLIGLQSNKETNVIQTYSDGCKTVTISSIDSLIPQIPSDKDSDDDDGDEESKSFTPTGPQPNLKQETNRLLRSTKAFKAAQKLKLKRCRPNPHRKVIKTPGDSAGDKKKKLGKGPGNTKGRKVKNKSKGKH